MTRKQFQMHYEDKYPTIPQELLQLGLMIIVCGLLVIGFVKI